MLLGLVGLIFSLLILAIVLWVEWPVVKLVQ